MRATVPGDPQAGRIGGTVLVTAECSRDGRFWFIRIPEVDGYTQATSLDDVVALVADLVSMKTVVVSDVQVEVHVETVSA